MQVRTNLVVRSIHWSIVFSLVFAFATAYCRQWFTTQSESANWYLLVIHMNVGVVIFALSVLAIRYRREMMAVPKKPISTRRRTMARIMHYALFFMLFALPTTAYIGTGFDFPLLGMVNLPGFMRFEIIQNFVQENLHMLMITLVEPFANFHRDTGADLVLPVLLIGHIGAAIFHRFESK